MISRLGGVSLVERLRVEGHTHWVTGALLLPDGHRALSWSFDNTLRLWDLLCQRELQRYIGDSPISAVVFSQERRLILAGGARGRVLRFDLPDEIE